ncbi:MAG: hypothetical protein RJA07_1158 [Bacteroidota bacterium]|jgi:hypothetical protein
MISNDTQQLIENILRGVIINEPKNLIAAARNKLCTSFNPSDATEKNFERFSSIKEEQKQSLLKFIEENNAWVSDENLK